TGSRVGDDVGRASDGRILSIIDGHGKIATGAVAGSIGRGASDGVGPFGKAGTARRNTRDAHSGTVVADDGREAHDCAALIGRRVGDDVGRASDSRILSIIDGQGKIATGAVAGSIGRRASDSVGSFGKAGAARRNARDAHSATVVAGGWGEAYDCAALTGSRVGDDVGRASDSRILSIIDGH